jgi:hypothetical protein
MSSIDWVPVVASLVLISAGLMFVFSPTLALKLLDFEHLVLGGRDRMAWWRDSPPEVSGYGAPDVVARSPGLKLGYRIGGALMTFLGVLLLFRALGN